MRETTKLINLENIGKKLEEVASKSLDECSVKMEKDILIFPVGPVPNKGFTEKFASELVDGVLAKTGFGKQQPQYQKDSSTRVNTAEVIDKFIEDRKFRGCRLGTTANYERFLKRSFNGFSHVPTDPTIIRGILSNFNGDTKLTYWLYFSAFYRFCEEEYSLPNPMVKVPRPNKRKTLPDHLNPEQKAQLQEADLSVRDRAVINLFAETAVRPGEVAGTYGNHPLRFCDIHEGHIEVSGKTGERIIPIRPKMRLMLLSLKDSRSADAPVFTSDNNGAALTRWGLHKVVKRAFATADIKGVKACPYTLRHSFGGDFLAQGGDVATLQRILGHKNVTTTMIYTHIADKAVFDAYRRHGPGANNNK